MNFLKNIIISSFFLIPTAALANDVAKEQNGWRLVAGWLILLFAAIVAIAFLIATIRHSRKHGAWVTAIVQEHFAATVGLPLAAVAALCVVILLKISEGPIEFVVLGLKFTGASGPVILWVLCFLAIASAIRLLWRLK